MDQSNHKWLTFRFMTIAVILLVLWNALFRLWLARNVSVVRRQFLPGYEQWGFPRVLNNPFVLGAWLLTLICACVFLYRYKHRSDLYHWRIVVYGVLLAVFVSTAVNFVLRFMFR